MVRKSPTAAKAAATEAFDPGELLNVGFCDCTAAELIVLESPDELQSAHKTTMRGKATNNRSSNISTSGGMRDSLPRGKGYDAKPSQQVLKNVVVPMNSRSRSSLRSSLSSIRDMSSELETPATSVAVTPAESLSKADLAKRCISSLGKFGASDAMSESSIRGKRKRAGQAKLLEADAVLVQALQTEEFERADSNGLTLRGSKKNRVQDSEDDAPSSSSVPQAFTEPASFRNDGFRSNSLYSSPSRAINQESGRADLEESFAAEMPSYKRVKTARHMPLPSRAARESKIQISSIFYHSRAHLR